ncbi:MAG: type II toxin-antitoxin system VapC family toxin [Burkholderiaceae bacterium]|nr:type II toxin-antitoxin system VapC family toxin [Burkholderiaceae bacterium]MCD8515734.1 type II toxin-antitoxin system VapC family toxin [Burkholderiaceae bacterium]MCD8536585.1 type II toxin-antitoxin system VapC family toxin [Burkholderiaceae bacterium]MCD8566253.1 type II toxin-antitoxin system VapC family toxin [Burkholderiaceae bacterium]
MNLLLDTHVALWAITDDPKLTTSARDLIDAEKTTVWVSVASLWEISIKHSLVRGAMPVSGRDAARFFNEAGYQILNIETEHATAIEHLPNHHQDPFDRLLIAQALVEPMRLMTRDAMVAKYSDTIIKI